MYSFSCSLFRWGWRYLCLRSPSLWCQASDGNLLATVVSPCQAPARLVLWQSWWSYTSIKREKGLCSNSAASNYLTIKVKVMLCFKSTFLFLTLTAALSHSQIPKIFFYPILYMNWSNDNWTTSPHFSRCTSFILSRWIKYQLGAVTIFKHPRKMK